ncbi:MAG: T9SS type A sorting domain-containing protein [Phycisphaerae bacterium]|nr:T9SS type A sorting domain-containing protein [Saprospiraceae bacterium]
MKRNLTLILLFVLAFGATTFAQVNKIKSNLPQPTKQVAVPAVKTHVTGFENTPNNHGQQSVPPAENSLLQYLGTTVYDLQSNGGIGHRIQNNGGGDLTGVFTFSQNVTGYPDRGTGYNTASAGTWGPEPTARVESVRTGFTNYATDAAGTEYVFTHAGTNRIHWAKRASGAGTWTEGEIPTTASGELWSRVAIGGSDGKTLHVIASTLPVGNMGTKFQGMDGVVVYFRSKDGGATWDIKDQLLPGIDSTHFTGTDVEGYAIDANGETIAIAVTNTWNDCLLYLSTDNGSSWEKRIVNDFPLDKYVVNTGYDPSVLPADPNAPTPYAIFTSDGTTDVLVDDAGTAHMWYGATYVNDSLITDTGWTFYPGTNIGIVYWNSTMADNSGFISGYCPDINNNQVLDVTDISNYGVGLSSWPAGSLDAAGNIYVAYSTVHELYLDINTGYNFRQPYIVSSADYGMNWTLPQAVMNPSLVEEDSVEVPYIEAIFTGAAKLSDDKVHVIFQADYSPLTNLNSNTEDTDPTDNSIRYIGYPTAWALVNAKNVPAETLKFDVLPNPANDRTVIQFNSDRTQTSNVEVYDMFGQVVRQTAKVTIGQGTGTVQMNTSDLPNGMYFARLNLGNAFATRKLMVQH